MTSLDAQSLSPGEFEVILEPVTDDAAVAQRVEVLASLRPNVVAAAPGRARSLVRGAWWFELGSALSELRPTLPPAAVQRIVELAGRTGLEAIVGQVAERGGGLVADVFATAVADPAGLPAGLPAGDIPGEGSVLTIRRADPSDAGDPGRVAVLGGGPVMVVAGLTEPEPLTDLVVDRCTASWEQGSVVLAVAGSRAGVAADALVRVVLADPATGTEHVLPSTATASTGSTGESAGAYGFAGSARLDLSQLDVADGRWQVRVSVHGGGSWCRQVAVPAVSVGPGLVAGRFVVPTSAGGELVCDVGARRSSPIGRLRVADAQVSDSARGTVLSIALPRLTVTCEADVPGFVVLGKLKVPGRVCGDADGARLEAYVSGLAGSSPLSTQFGRAKATATGLNLDISPTGVMTVTRTPAPASSPASAPAPGPVDGAATTRVAAATAAAQPLVTRLRRRTPQALEPAVRALAKVPVARTVYRALRRS